MCRYLVLNRLAKVVNVDLLTYAASLGSLRQLEGNPLYHFIQQSVCNAQAMQEVFSQYEPDGVIHLAAESHVDRSISGTQPFIQTNIVGTSVLLDSALMYWGALDSERRDGFKFLHVSTDEVYGSLGKEGAFHEEMAYDPSSPYSASKAASDHLVTAWGKTYGLPVVISNCSNNYGPYQFPEKMIPLTILNVLHGKSIPIYGDGKQVRDWLHVDDHVEALWLIWQKGRVGEKYNVGGMEEHTNLELVQMICSVLDDLQEVVPEGGHASLIEFVTDRQGHDARYFIDPSKIKSELSWHAKRDFTEGLRETIVWYLSNRWWWETLFPIAMEPEDV